MTAKLNALDPNSIQIDGRSLLDRLHFAACYAELIYFYDHHNQRNGTWHPFLLKDPVVLLAYISKTNYQDLFATFAQIERNWVISQKERNVTNQIQLLNQTFLLLYSLFETINKWLESMFRCEKSYELKTFVIKKIQDQQSPNLRRILALQQHLAQYSQTLETASEQAIVPPNYSALDQFHNLWHTHRLNHHSEVASPQNTASEKEEEPITMLQMAFQMISQIYEQTFEFYLQVIHHAKTEYTHMLQEKNHPFPDTLLLIAFTQLMEFQQKQLNQIANRHLEFYYKDILKQQPRAALADETYLFLTLASNVESFTVPVSFPFNAGMDETQNPILFETEEDSVVNHIGIHEVFTLSPHFCRRIPAPTEIRKNEQGEEITWETFGNSEKQRSIENELLPVSLGLAVASPILFLENGERTITITFHWHTDGTPEDLSHFFFKSQFGFSTANGWHSVIPETIENITSQQKQESSKDAMAVWESQTCTKIMFHLSATEPPIAPFEEPVDNLNTVWPLLKVDLSQSVRPSQTLRLKDLTIRVEVNGLSQLELANDEGALPIDTPFLPFGSMPTQGGRFLVRSRECFAKPLSVLSLNVQWEDLPNDFNQYYQPYNDYLKAHHPAETPAPYFTNEAFKVRSSIANLAKECEDLLFSKQTFPLLAPNSPHSSVPELLLPNRPLTQNFDQDLIQIVLTEPQYAFGHSLYPQVVSQVALDNAIDISSAMTSLIQKAGELLGLSNLKGQLQQLPNAPYSPRIRKLTLDYTAEASLVAQDTTHYPMEYYHYSPFATYPVYSKAHPLTFGAQPQQKEMDDPSSPDGIDLFPFFPEKGGLYLALRDLPKLPSTLSLYFEVAQNGRDDQQEGVLPKNQPLFYWVLTKIGWQSLTILKDETARLTQSGILLIMLPKALSLENPMMPGPYCWISITRSGVPAANVSSLVNLEKPENYTRTVVCLNTQAIKVKRKNIAAFDPGLAPSLSAEQITSPLRRTPEIREIVQPFSSREGRPAETAERFYQRVSHRLKTKDRAISKRDYTLMALESEPQLAYAKCLAGTPTVMAIVQKYETPTVPNAFRPIVPPFRRQKLKTFFQKRISPFIRLEVLNMEHQEVTILCQLVLRKPENAGMVTKRINEALRLYLSPWIESNQAQLPMDQGLHRVDLLSFLAAQSDVLYVEKVGLQSFRGWRGMTSTQTLYSTDNDWQTVYPRNERTLFISSPQHQIEVVNPLPTSDGSTA